ncbi:autotransporter outer membrane beta-barrel domain-containing protein [Nissabacter sp. SGAir0207]|uniref:autotransporter outer membrane beta-barrel domain-containing protein n=1 Tax=Nissabacter sp. SGAir0207 TaxID=2126321 RepID=UPI0010CD56B2|nr:autotransporter domain-containing protein [Nissabacter sp. SGAir0207]QCR34602.1 autotransporter domain-containing esterase [Nissabacter sp. SGAir0207]
MPDLKKFRCRRKAGALAVAMLFGGGHPALAYDNLYVFGDSLSDSGNIGRFTYNSANVALYDEILAARAGLTLSPSFSGGTNYATGGATAIPELNPDYNATSDQVSQYLAQTGGRAEGDGLYIHWVGGNDLAAAATLAASALNADTAFAVANLSANAAAGQVQSLINAGAGTVIVPTVPNIGLTPAILELVVTAALPASALQAAFSVLNSQSTVNAEGRVALVHQALTAAAESTGAPDALAQTLSQALIGAYDQLSAEASALTDAYNQTEDAALAASGGNIVRVDVDGLLNEVVADPALYGLTNTAGMACPPGLTSALCTADTAGFSDAQAFLFADHLHPSPQTHALIADYMQAVLDGPAQAVALNQATLSMGRNARGILDSRFQQLRANPGAQGSLGLFGGYMGQHMEYTANTTAGDGNATSHNAALGMDYQLTDNWTVGALLSGANDRQHPSSRYDYKARGWLISAYTAVNVLENGWINADVHWAKVNFDDINRSMRLGPATRTEHGETEGEEVGGRLTAGWDIPVAEWLSTGPLAQFAWDYSSVDGYSERSSRSTAMRFDDQTYHSQIGALGWRLDARFDRLNPYAELSYQHQFGDDVYRAGGGIKSTQTHFTRTSATQDTNWVDVTVGANLPLTDNIDAFAAVSQTGGLSSGEQFMYNLGVSARF